MNIALLIVGLLLLGAFAGEACTPALQADAADKAYAADHLRCVQEYDTKLEIDACRERVRIRWGIQTTVHVKDAGGQ